jgi:hypothetical protein
MNLRAIGCPIFLIVKGTAELIGSTYLILYVLDRANKPLTAFRKAHLVFAVGCSVVDSR